MKIFSPLEPNYLSRWPFFIKIVKFLYQYFKNYRDLAI